MAELLRRVDATSGSGAMSQGTRPETRIFSIRGFAGLFTRKVVVGFCQNPSAGDVRAWCSARCHDRRQCDDLRCTYAGSLSARAP